MDAIHGKRSLDYSSDRPKGFTTREYAHKYGLTFAGAEHRLRRLSEAGDLVSEWAIVDGKRCRVYRPA